MVYVCEYCGKKFKEAALAEQCEAEHLEEEKKLDARNKEMAKDAEEIKAAHKRWQELSEQYYRKYYGIEKIALNPLPEFFLKRLGL